MNTISLISAIAVVVSLGGVLPQIVAMLRARSSAGQSALGWSLGVLVNGLLGYVNAAGAQSAVLTSGNALGLLLSAVALALVFRYRLDPALQRVIAADPSSAVSTLLDPARTSLVELRTEELEALHGAVSHARETRQQHAGGADCAGEGPRRAPRRRAGAYALALKSARR